MNKQLIAERFTKAIATYPDEESETTYGNRFPCRNRTQSLSGREKVDVP